MSAIPKNGISPFSATGIFPFNPEAIPDYAFIHMRVTDVEQGVETQQLGISSDASIRINELTPTVGNFAENTSTEASSFQSPVTPQKNQQSDLEVIDNMNISDITPGKMLEIISPIPSTSTGKTNNSRKQKTRVLTAVNNIKQLKLKSVKRKITNTNKTEKVKKNRKKVVHDSSTEDEDIAIPLDDESDGLEDFEENICAGCGEDYNSTSKKDDWIQCILCNMWSHDTCTFFVNTCNKCGKQNVKKR